MEGRADAPLNGKQDEHAPNHWQNFPAGLRLLVVDDDPVCLKLVEQMLRKCSYEVTTCANATMALRLLREKNTEYDLVLSDVYMPDMDGFKLLEVVGLEMDLPVIMMSSNGDTSNVFRGVTHGACDYLIKPVRLEELRNLWQHVVRRRRQHAQEVDSDEQSQERDEDQSRNKRKADAAGFLHDQYRGGLNGGGGSGAADELGLDGGSNKKARVVWSVEMHQKFVNAVNQLGIDKAVPKKILEIMGVDGLTRENVASHLQKYRLYLRRVSGVHQHAGHQTRPPPKSSPTPPLPQGQPLPMQAPTGLQPPPPQQQQPSQQIANGGVSPSAGAAAAAMAGGGQQPGGPQPPGAAPSMAQMTGGGADDGVNSMAVAAVAAAAGAFPVLPPPPQPQPHPPPQHQPHPATLLAANPMMAAAAGLNPLLGAMGGLGVGPLGVGPLGPLNGLPLPGMQPPLGLLPGLAGPGGQPGMGQLGPMGLPGLASLPGALPGGLPMNPMAGGLQQMAAANLMQGMAGGMAQLPALAVNGLMGPLPGVGLTPGPHQQPMLPPQHQQQLAELQQQQQQQQQQLQQQANLQQQLSMQLQQQASLQQHASLQQQLSIQQQQQQQRQLQQLQHQTSLNRLSLQQQPQSQQQQQQQQHQSPQLQQAQHGSLAPAGASPHLHALPQLSQHQQQSQQQQLSSTLGVMPGAAAALHAASLQAQHPVHADGSLATAAAQASLPSDLMGVGLMDVSGRGNVSSNGFGARARGSVQQTHGTVPGLVDTNILLDGEDPSDIAAVFQEMYGNGGGAGGGSGPGGGGGTNAAAMAVAAMPGGPRGHHLGAVGMLGVAGDSGGLMAVPDPNRGVVMEDDFFSFLLKN
ncbi:hypothetical protein Agub_g5987 [Astrephomene gubernaculifera]|uniref:Two-component response regulator n=1 Tax=Astrephomene gubernaculifera TaxID=47775 RepID=A0AAD3HKH9_9CHLO|nr:hypothetical protein Agub_g5987 [Astrephomene gubernaculifera]